MATAVFKTAKSNSFMSGGLQDYFSLAPTALPAKDSFDGNSSLVRSPEWFLPKELRDDLSVSLSGSSTIGRFYAKDEEGQIIFPIFSPLRYIGKVGNPIVSESPYTSDELTTDELTTDELTTDKWTTDEWTTDDSDSDSDSDLMSDLDSDSLPSNRGASTTTPPPQSPQPAKYAEDDTAVRMLSTRSVDLFSHRWSLEEVRSSRKEIRSNRGAYSNNVRLEYALWRAWTKCMKKSRTALREKFLWKEDDGVTWLYAPMAPASYNASETLSPSIDRAGQTPKLNGVSYLKPILKKRSMSQMMLERSRFNCSLPNRATVTVKAQQLSRKYKSRPLECDHVTPIQKNRVRFIGAL